MSLETPDLGLSEEQRQEVREAFALFVEEDGGGGESGLEGAVLREADLHVALQALGFEPGPDEARTIITAYTGRTEVGGGLTVDEFEDVMAAKLAEDMDDALLDKGFALLDVDGSGALTLDSLRAVAAEMGEELTDEQLTLMITQALAAAGLPPSGTVTKDAFAAIMKQ